MTILCAAAEYGAAGLADALGGTCRAARTLSEVEHLLADDPDEVLVVVGPDSELSEALAFAARHRSARPALGVVLMRDSLDVVVLSRALQTGVREVVPAADVDLLVDACLRSLEVSRSVSAGPARAGSAKQARIATVLSTKGGCGKTTMATNLAVALHAGGERRVCLVDLDLAFGDVAISLQLAPRRTLVEGVAMGDRIDQTGVSGLLTPFRPGLDCVLAPVEPGDAEKVPAALIGELLDVLRDMFDYVVVDTPPQFNEHVLTALDRSDHHVLLTNPDMPTLKNLRLSLDMLDLLSYSRDQRAVVLNREDPRVGMTAADVETVARGPLAARIPSSLDVPAALNRGVPITLDAPGHPVSVAIREFAAQRIVGIPPAPAPTRGRFLARLRGRSA